MTMGYGIRWKVPASPLDGCKKQLIRISNVNAKIPVFNLQTTV